MIALLVAAGLVAIVSSALSARLGRLVFLVPAVLSAAAAAWIASLAPQIAHGGEIVESVAWMPSLDIELAFRMGAVQWLLAMVVTGVGALILGYCAWYFDSESLAPRTVGLLTGFAGSMLGLVLADDLVVLYVAWELTTVFSYLLVGLNHRSSKNRSAAQTALIVTTIGGLAMLVGVLMLGNEAGTHSLHALIETPPTTPLAAVAVVLVLAGALSKSAIVPFHFWLPGAMAAPTPVSAFLHAAAMVKAGIYLVAVLTPAFADLPFWRPLLVSLGVVTMVLGALRALRQLDIKVLLAHGTVSQLGLLITVLGIGTRASMLAGLALLAAHAVFKASLFMVVGIVDRTTGTRSLSELGGLARRMPWLAAIAMLSAAAMAGLPPTLTFAAKEMGLEAGWSATHEVGIAPWIGWLAFAGIAVGAALTIAYSLRFIVGTFFGPMSATCRDSPGAPARGPRLMLVFPGILAVAGLALGIAPDAIQTVLHHGIDAVPTGESEHLALWHGITPSLVATVVAMVAGVALWWVLGRARREPETGRVSMSRGYQLMMRGIDRLAVEVTGRTQWGSLPVNVAAILLTIIALPGLALVTTGSLSGGVRVADSVGQLVVGAAMIVAALFAAGTRGRLKTFMLLSVVGYGTALMFLLHGAPDLALTQVLSETVFLVLLVLVLRRLPKYFTDRPLRAVRWFRALLGALVGIAAALIALAAANARTATPISERFYELAHEFGYGENIVNVTLVDIRAWDTMGEISVLLVAATGVASLIFIRTRAADPSGTLSGDRGRPSGERAGMTAPGTRISGWLRGARSIDEHRRAPMLEIMTRLLFPVMILVAVHLVAIGHDLPGGGFVGGLVAGLALAMRYLAAGADELAEAAPFDAGRLLGAGVVTSAIGMLWPVLIGGRIGESYAFDLHVWGLGELHVVTSLLFDIGVFLVVVGTMLDFIRSLGAGIDAQARAHIAPVPSRQSDRTTPGIGGRG